MGQVVGHDLPLDGVRVLLVEDHPVVREVIGRLLGEFGAAVTAAAGVADALIAFDRERFDVVLSDIEMVDGDGYALIRKLRALPAERGGRTPVAGLTGLSMAEDRARVLDAGFQCYVAKPVDARMLVSVVATLASRSGTARKNPGRTPPYLRTEPGRRGRAGREVGGWRGRHIGEQLNAEAGPGTNPLP